MMADLDVEQYPGPMAVLVALQLVGFDEPF